jgi:hypothetical protein
MFILLCTIFSMFCEAKAPYDETYYKETVSYEMAPGRQRPEYVTVTRTSRNGEDKSYSKSYSYSYMKRDNYNLKMIILGITLLIVLGIFFSSSTLSVRMTTLLVFVAIAGFSMFSAIPLMALFAFPLIFLSIMFWWVFAWITFAWIFIILGILPIILLPVLFIFG